MSTHRVLIADDESGIRSALRLLLDSEPDIVVVGEASDGTEAVELAVALEPDVVLMDVQMPRMNGLDATRALCATSSALRVVMLTMFDLDEYVYEALRAGASGFLLKNSPPNVVLGAIRTASEGASLLSPQVTMRLIEHLAPVRADKRVERLTARERETLKLIGQGLSNDELAAELFITPTTSRTYVSRLLTKLEARDRSQLVVIAYENGLT